MNKIFVIFFSLFIFFSSSTIYADSSLFSDDFSDSIKTTSQWETQFGNWYTWGPLVSNWTIDSGTYKTMITQAYRASVTLGGDINWSNYKIFADVKSGDGVDQSILFRVRNSGTFYGLDIRAKWNDQGIESLGNVLLFKWINGVQSILVHYPYDIHNDEWYKVKITLDGSTISVRVQDRDEDLTPISFDYNDGDISSGRIGLQSWSGQFLQMYPSSQVIKYFDNILVLGPPPVVLLPGLGTSWNSAILTGGEAVQSEWKIPWFVKHYKGLADTLVNAGYTKGQNLFTFAYDWRKPVDQTADVLKNYLETVVEPQNPGQKVDLVGHSLGGLVARAYSQKYGNGKVDKVVSVGSPHSGAVQSYLAWSGGEIHQDKLWMQLVLELLLQANKTGFMTNADVIRTKIPSIRDILPTFDYLKKNSSPYPAIPLNSMNSLNRNFWLEGLNGSVNSSFFDVFTAIEGNKGDTPEWYRVRKQNWYEKMLELWQDGKPAYTENGFGDAAVLAKSGKIEPDTHEEVNDANHIELVTTERGIQKIMDVLGLTPSAIVTYPEFDFTNGLLFTLFPLGKLHITGPSGTFDSDGNKLILIPNALSGDYTAEVIGEGSGIYTLLVGQKIADKTFWSKFMGEEAPGSSKTYQFSFDMDHPNPSPLSDHTGVEYLKAAYAKLKTLPSSPLREITLSEINKIISLIEEGRKIQALNSFILLLKKFFAYYKGISSINELNILFDALLDIQNAYVILADSLHMPALKDMANGFIEGAKGTVKGVNEALEVLSLLNRVTKIQALSFANAVDMFDTAKTAFKENDFNRAIILSQIAIFLAKEAVGM